MFHRSSFSSVSSSPPAPAGKGPKLGEFTGVLSVGRKVVAKMESRSDSWGSSCRTPLMGGTGNVLDLPSGGFLGGVVFGWEEVVLLRPSRELFKGSGEAFAAAPF